MGPNVYDLNREADTPTGIHTPSAPRRRHGRRPSQDGPLSGSMGSRSPILSVRFPPGLGSRARAGSSSVSSRIPDGWVRSSEQSISTRVGSSQADRPGISRALRG